MQEMTASDATFSSHSIPNTAIAAARPPLHEIFVPFPVAYFTAAFVTDLVYWHTPDVMWERFSVWLIAAGLVMAAFALIAAAIDLAVGRQKPAWLRVVGYAAAVLLSVANVFVHSRDGYTAVVPTGLTLSAIAVIILLFTSSAGWALTYPRRDGAGT